jgi:hypothetical protein
VSNKLCSKDTEKIKEGWTWGMDYGLDARDGEEKILFIVEINTASAVLTF